MPFGWDRYRPAHSRPAAAARRRRSARSTSAAPPGPGLRRTAWPCTAAEEAGEELRLLYVALTRAQCQVVTWWAPSTNTPAVGRCTGCCSVTHEPGEVPTDTVPVPSDEVARTRLAELVGAARRGAGRSRRSPVDPGARWRPPPRGPQPALAAAAFDRALDTAWRAAVVHRADRGSARAAGRRAAAVAESRSEPEERELDDETGAGPPAGSTERSGRRPGPTPRGACGTLRRRWPTCPAGRPSARRARGARARRHRRPRPRGRARRALPRRAGRSGSARRLDPEALAAALLPALRHAARAARRRSPAASTSIPATGSAELDFELPLAGGDDRPAARWRRSTAIGRGCCAGCRADDPLAAYADLLGELAAPIAARLPARQHRRGAAASPDDRRVTARPPRYLVVDYKTNWLGAPGRVRRAADRLALPAGGAGRRDARRALPAAGAAVPVALHRYLRLAAARLRPGRAPRRRALPVRARHVRRRRPRSSTACRAACSPGSRRPALVDGAVRPAGGRCAVTAESDRGRRRSTPGWRCGRPGCCATFNAAGVLSAADVHVAQRLGRLGGEPDERVLLAAALAVRAVRHGLGVRRPRDGPRDAPTADEESTRSTLDALPWPEPDALAGGRARPARWSRSGRRRPGPAAAAGRRTALPRPLLAAGGAGPPRARRRGCGVRPCRSTRTALADGARRGCSRAAGRPASGCAAAMARCAAVTRARRRAGHRQDHDGRRAARAAARPARAGRCRGSRWPRRPARPRPGCRRRCARRRAAAGRTDRATSAS